jgi:hypothetical protein
MAPRSVAADAGTMRSPSKPTPVVAAKKSKAWIPPVSYDEEPVPVMGQDYNGSFLGHGYPELPLIKRLDWLHVPLLTITPLIALYGLATVPLRWQTLVWSIFYYFVTGLGITAGAWRGGGCGRRQVSRRGWHPDARGRRAAGGAAAALTQSPRCMRRRAGGGLVGCAARGGGFFAARGAVVRARFPCPSPSARNALFRAAARRARAHRGARARARTQGNGTGRRLGGRGSRAHTRCVPASRAHGPSPPAVLPALCEAPPPTHRYSTGARAPARL